MTQALKPGDRAPDFDLPGSGGKIHRLADFHGKTLVLYFYPKDETLGCTAEACSFRDAYQDFTDAGAVVLGVSADSVVSHDDFAAHHRLPFLLASDAGDVVRNRYGVRRTLGIFPGRETFVIDRDGVVRHAFSSQLRVNAHVAEALAVVRALESKATSR